MDPSSPRPPLLQKFGEHPGHVYAVAWNTDGSSIACGGGDKSVKVFKFTEASIVAAPSGAGGSLSFGGQHQLSLVGSIAEHKHTVEGLAWDPNDASRLCSVSAGLVHLADVSKLKKARSAAVTHKLTASLFCVAYARNGRHIAVSGREQDRKGDSLTVLEVEPRRLKPTAPARQFGANVNMLAWAPDSRHLLVAESGEIDVVAAATLETVMSFRAHNNAVYALSFTSDGSAFAVGSGDSLVSVWNTDELACHGCLSAEPSAVRAVSWDPTDRHVAWSCESNKLFVGEAGTSRAFVAAAADAAINDLAFHPRLPILAAACDRSAAVGISHGGQQHGWVHLFTFR